MPRVGTVAAGLGVLTGSFVVLGFALGYLGQAICSGDVCELTFIPPPLVEALSVVLILDSLVCLVGPRRVFYVSALVSAATGGLVILGTGNLPYVIAAMGLSVSEVALSLAAARREVRVSEQSHPMNLPVFG